MGMPNLFLWVSPGRRDLLINIVKNEIAALFPNPAQPAPRITQISSDHVGPGWVVTIYGEDFGYAKGKVYLGSHPCLVTSWYMLIGGGTGMAIFRVPEDLPDGRYNVTVVNDAGSATLKNGLTVE